MSPELDAALLQLVHMVTGCGAIWLAGKFISVCLQIWGLAGNREEKPKIPTEGGTRCHDACHPEDKVK